MLKVLTILGTRPEIIRLSCILDKLNYYFNHKLLHTGQNSDFELYKIFFDQLNLKKPDYYFDCKGTTAAEKISNILSNTDKIIRKFRPDAILILGDTNSSLSAISAKKNKIPIFHLEAGNRCYDQRVPEEINRKIVDHISDVNLTYSNIARENLLKENFPSSQVIKVGSPLFEVINTYKENIEDSKILIKLGLTKEKYFLTSFHREENIDNNINLNKIINIINTLAENYKLKIVFSVHPRTLKKIKSKKIKLNKLIKIYKPLSFFDYVKLQINAKITLSDSGSITEESSILNFPALNIRETHERQEGMEEGAVIMTGLSIKNVLQGLKILKNQNRGSNRNINIVSDYKQENVSDKVVKIILSYTDYIKRVVWKNY